jgi:UDP-N-acetylglucosamine 4-epimerase
LNANLQTLLARENATWLVTGAAGFIGSNLVEVLLRGGQKVVGLDNFATGHQRNLDELQRLLPEEYAGNFRMVEGDIRDRDTCRSIVEGVDFILHQAALGSVPRSIDDPVTSHNVNVTGFVNMLDAARQAEVKRFIYAASSSTYGDSTELPKREDRIGQPLSPYALTKLVNEQYAAVYARNYGFKATGLRYFNVFGPRQDPNGAYAAVIPKWVSAMITDDIVTINGDGLTTRDFCYVANAVQANIRAALAPDDAQGEVYNVAVGDRTSLLDLFQLLQNGLAQHQVHYHRDPVMGPFRRGDVRDTQASIEKAQRLLDYSPTHNLAQGLDDALPWYLNFFRSEASPAP